MRREFSKKVKAAAFLRANGHCEECGAVLRPGKFAYDHHNPDGLTGKPTLENCRVLCTPCHSEKTHKRDRPRIRKAQRREEKHVMGIRNPSKFRGWRKMNGEIVWNDKR